MQKNKTKSSNKGSFSFEKGGSLNDKNFIKHICLILPKSLATQIKRNS